MIKNQGVNNLVILADFRKSQLRILIAIFDKLFRDEEKSGKTLSKLQKSCQNISSIFLILHFYQFTSN